MSLLAGRAAAARQREADAGRWQRALRAGRRWGLWGAALGTGLGLATQAPAQWLADSLQHASGGRLLLAEARGSLWNGSAVLVLTGGTGSRDASALPGRLEWTLRPGLSGLQLSAQQACCLPQPLRLHLTPGWSGYTLRVGDALTAAPGATANAAPLAAPAAPATPEAPGNAAAQVLGQWPASWLAGIIAHRPPANPHHQVSESAQMLLAQFNAYTPSSSLGAGLKPPEPATVLNVFSAATYSCTLAT